jgi:peptidoglycan/LPS O-acetylase OafA/YrhL
MVAVCHFVIAFHISMLTGDRAAAHFAAEPALSHTAFVLFINSEFCITIFFVISGFVLAAGAAQPGARFSSLAARRWLRLAGPVTAASLFAWAIPVTGLNFAQAAAALSHSSWLAQQYGYIAPSTGQFIQLIFESLIVLIYPQAGWGTMARYYNSNLWTMPVEFAGSLALFLCYVYLLSPHLRSRPARIAILAVIAALIWHTAFFGFPAGALLFEAGEWCRAIGSRGLRTGAMIAGPLLFAAGLIGGSTPFELNLQGGGIYPPLAVFLYRFTAPVSSITVMHQAGAVCLVTSALLFSPFRTLLETAVMQSLGKISFMVYLLQIPILCSLGAFIVVRLSPAAGYNAATAIAAIVYLAGTLAAAAGLTALVDGPAIAASRRLGRLVDRQALPF